MAAFRHFAGFLVQSPDPEGHLGAEFPADGSVGRMRNWMQEVIKSKANSESKLLLNLILNVALNFDLQPPCQRPILSSMLNREKP